jgi:DNA mismatch repair protein MutS2
MTFAPGDAVHIAGIGTGTVREARNGGRYSVEVKGRSMIVDGSRLAPATRVGRRRPASSVPPSSDVPPHLARQAAALSIDLHGLTVADAIVALDRFLDEAILAGAAEVRVIHGKSGGRIKQAVHRRLRTLPPVRGVRLDPSNPGVTIVSL